MRVARPTTLTIACTILVFDQLSSLFKLLLGGMPAGAEQIPQEVFILSLIVGLLSGVAAYGLWTMRRWGMILTVVLMALNILSAAPGLLFAPTRELWTLALTGILTGVAIIALVLLPASRRAYGRGGMQTA